MSTAKRTIHLTDDNWSDHLPTDYAESLVALATALGTTLDGLTLDGRGAKRKQKRA